MPNATIVRVWQDGTNAHIAARVAEGGSLVNVEYIASVPLVDLNLLGTNAEKKVALTTALKAKRDATLGTAAADIAGISGTLTV